MIYIKGDLIDAFKRGDVNIILHQCNCFVAGAGIARRLQEEFNIMQSMNEVAIRNYATVSWTQTEYGVIGNLYSQYAPGGCSYGIDSFEMRIAALLQCLKEVKGLYGNIGIPLIASGLAADSFRKRKDNLTDMEYFLQYISPLFEEFENLKIYYL